MATVNGEAPPLALTIPPYTSPFVTVWRPAIAAVTTIITEDPPPGFTRPQLTVLSSFSVDFATARLEPWSATIDDFPQDERAVPIVLVQFESRNEMIVARNADGEWCWPFDVEPDNNVDVSSNPGSIALLPRGGWPAGRAEIQLAAAVMAEEVVL